LLDTDVFGMQDTSEGALAASAGPGSTVGPMSGSQLNAGSALRTLIGQKEKELHDMNEYRIQVDTHYKPAGVQACTYKNMHASIHTCMHARERDRERGVNIQRVGAARRTLQRW